MSELLTQEENEVLQTLADAWNKFVALPSLHPVDNHEFMHAIHTAQNIILARPYLRSLSNNARTGLAPTVAQDGTSEAGASQ